MYHPFAEARTARPIVKKSGGNQAAAGAASAGAVTMPRGQ